jgi:hypothetical protein
MSKPLLVSGTIPQILNPFPSFGENLPKFRKPITVPIFETPVMEVDTEVKVPVFRNKQKAPGTKPTYGFLMPGRF